MNRRTFLTGLLASGAALSTTSSVVQVLAPEATTAELLALFEQRILAASTLMHQMIEKNLMRGTFDTPGGLASLLELDDLS